jgi:hypothetical protein
MDGLNGLDARDGGRPEPVEMEAESHGLRCANDQSRQSGLGLAGLSELTQVR